MQDKSSWLVCPACGQRIAPPREAVWRQRIYHDTCADRLSTKMTEHDAPQEWPDLVEGDL